MDPNEIMRQFFKIKIKPCPFCGKQPLFIANENRIVCSSGEGRCVCPKTGCYGRWSDL